jgi:hypothetical protein
MAKQILEKRGVIFDTPSTLTKQLDSSDKKDSVQVIESSQETKE